MPKFQITDGKFGKRLIVRSAWTNALARIVQRESVAEVELNYAKGWSDNDISFLSDVPEIVCLDLLNWDAKNLRVVESLRKLKSLNISTYSKEIIDFRVLTSLVECRIEWNSGFKSVLDVRHLQLLTINRPPKSIIKKIGQLSELQELSLLSCSTDSLEPIAALARLKYLRLALFRKLEDIRFISNLENLEELWAQNVRGFYDLSPLSNLKKLTRLNLESCGPYNSVKPIFQLPALKVLILSGRKTSFDVGSKEDLKTLPNLTAVIY